MNSRPSIKEFAKELYRIWATERPGQLAAAIAYYGMFAFAPVIFFAFWVAGLFIDQLSAADQFFTRMENLFGSEVTLFIQDSVTAIAETTTESSIIATLISVGALLLAASGLFNQLLFALNKIWGVPPPERGQTKGLIRQRLFSFFNGDRCWLDIYPRHTGQCGPFLVWFIIRPGSKHADPQYVGLLGYYHTGICLDL